MRQNQHLSALISILAFIIRSACSPINFLKNIQVNLVSREKRKLSDSVNSTNLSYTLSVYIKVKNIFKSFKFKVHGERSEGESDDNSDCRGSGQ